MTDIYLVDRPSRIEDLIRQMGQNWPADQLPVGVGFFQCTKSGETAQDRGVSFKANPEHLRGALLAEILSGRISPLNQEPVLFGIDSAARSENLENDWRQSSALQRWLLWGLHSLDDLVQVQVPISALNQRLAECAELSEAVDLLIGEILIKVKEISAPGVVFPISSPLLVEFFYSILGPVPFGLGLRADRVIGMSKLETIEQEIISRKVFEAIVMRISSNPPECNTILQCDSEHHLHGLTSICRNLKARGGAAEVLFRV